MPRRPPRPTRHCQAETRTCACTHHQRTHQRVAPDQPKRGPCTVEGCACQRFAGKPCTQDKVDAKNSRCRLHGGPSLGGLASPTYRHGRTSKYRSVLTETLARWFDAFSADPQLLDLHDEIAVTGALATEALARVAQDGSDLDRWQALRRAYAEMQGALHMKDTAVMRVAFATMGEILEGHASGLQSRREYLRIIDSGRKLIETEMKRRVAAEQVVTWEQLAMFLAAYTASVKKHVSDPKMRAAILMEFERLTTATTTAVQ